MKYAPSDKSKEQNAILQRRSYDTVVDLPHQLTEDYHVYTMLKNKPIEHTTPINKITTPSKDDYDKGYYERVIIQRRNDKREIFEIDIIQADKYGAPTGINDILYELVKFNWSLLYVFVNINVINNLKITIPYVEKVLKSPQQFVRT